MKIKKLIPCLLALAAVPALAAASTATPKRIGPVSYYGALHTDGGKIVGAKNGQEAMIRGMSLFWSDATGMPYYNKNVITWAAENLPMDVFRFAMGITYYDSDGGTSNALDEAYSYAGAPDGYMGIIDQMVEAATGIATAPPTNRISQRPSLNRWQRSTKTFLTSFTKSSTNP